MVEGPTIMLGVFIALLCIHTMPNIYYCSTCMLLYPHLMAKLVESWQKIKNLRHETCQHGAVKVWWRDLQSCWECSSTCYTPIQCQTSTIAAPTWWHTPTWWPNIAWKSAGNPNLRHEVSLHGAVKYGGGPYNHAGSVHCTIMHPYNAKHLLL